MGRVTRKHAVLRLGPGSARRRTDVLAVEEPLEVRLDGQPYLVTMRTPGHDVDLVH
ncbi:MAG: sulfurtransferase FdhD, partial [Actinomycetes bacterium]